MQKTFTRLSYDQTTQLHGKIYYPSVPAKGMVFIHHGMSEHARRYEYTSFHLANNGFIVLTYDALGHGQSILNFDHLGRSPYAPYNDCLIHDAKNILLDFYNINTHLPLFIFGHSLGSFVLRNMLKDTEMPPLAGSIFMGTGHMNPLLFKLASTICASSAKLRGNHHRSVNVATLFMYYVSMQFKPHASLSDWLTTDQLEVTKVLSDPVGRITYADKAYSELFRMISTADAFEKQSSISRHLPLLFLSGEYDIVGHFGKDAIKLLTQARKSGFTDVSSIIYQNARHELLHEKCTDVVLKDLTNWLHSKCL